VETRGGKCYKAARKKDVKRVEFKNGIEPEMTARRESFHFVRLSGTEEEVGMPRAFVRKKNAGGRG